MNTKLILVLVSLLLISCTKTKEDLLQEGIEAQISLDTEDAIEKFSQAIQLDNNYLEAYNHRGLAYFNMKNYRKAIEDYSVVLESDPKNDRVLSMLTSSPLAQFDTLFSKKSIESAIKLDSTNAKFHLYYAKFNLINNNMELACQSLEKASRFNTDETVSLEIEKLKSINCKE